MPYPLRHPKSLARVTLHVPSTNKKLLLGAAFALLYALVLPWVYGTVGQPYEAARKELGAILGKRGGKAAVKVSRAHKEVLDAGGVSETTFGEDDEDEENAFGSRRVKKKQRQLKKELRKKMKKEGMDVPAVDVEQLAQEDKERLPSPYLPSALASLALFMLGSGTALFFLLQKWLVWFRVWAFYDDATAIHAGCVAQVTPPPHRGKAAVAPLTLHPTLQCLQFKFQRQSYDVFKKGHPQHDATPAAADAAAAEQMANVSFADEESSIIVGEGQDNGTVRLIACPVDKPVADYTSHEGLSKRKVKHLEELYGHNVLAVELPKFIDLWIERLLSPISMFQLFSAALWLLDAYWQYTIMTLIQILILESTTVFQRLKTLKQLKGMSVKSFDVWVYRDGAWCQETTTKLVPGDLISLKVSRPKAAEAGQVTTTQGASKSAATATAKPTLRVNPYSNIVPVDCVMVRGSAVVNEATLTGESIPQMKDALSASKAAKAPGAGADDGSASGSARFDMNGDHRVHTLFSGTSLVATAPGKVDKHGVPATPDSGVLCYVLRTGFNSSQGKLVQLIEFSQQSVSGDTKETAMALLLLLCFALAAAGYVLKKGLESGDRTTHELLIKCVIILTAVVPRQLPLQMAFAVNQAIMALNGKAIMCTEPFRVPSCGKTTHCIFDKTGTLTTDQLLPIGIVNADGQGDGSSEVKRLLPVMKADGYAAMVLGACHSLIHVEGAGMMGDPIETAGLKGIGWAYNARTETSTPGDWQSARAAASKTEEELKKRPNDKNLKKRLELLHKAEGERKAAGEKCPVASAKILHRYHFSSKLQRMSVVARLAPNHAAPANADDFRGDFALVKGSPEAIKALLVPDFVPAWYDSCVFEMTHRGYRVLALAYRPLKSGQGGATLAREAVESNLRLAGFIAFECKSRADSRTVVQALRQSNHTVVMATGDNALTALHVGRAVGICDAHKPYLVLKTGDDGARPAWHTTPKPGQDLQKDVERIPFEAAKIVGLAEKFSLATTEKALDAAAAVDDAVWDHVDRICIFSRMSPQGKARVIRAMQQRQGHQVFMCGDGGNDVGALKQADVGLALLSGYGNTNTTGESKDPGADGGVEAKEGSAEEMLNEQQRQLKRRGAKANAKVKDQLDKKRKELTAKIQTVYLQEAIAARHAKGESGFFVQIGALKDATARMQRELVAERQRLQKIHGNVFDDKPPSMDSLLDSAGSDSTIIRPGDASIAAPFTSRQPSIKSAIDLIRQGRCTLLNALQQQQTMMLECIISAYVLSALSLEGSRSSERQLMASSWLIMTASVAFSYAKPIDRVSKVRPLKSVFHPAVFVSIVGQACIHVFCMWYAVRMATEAMGEDKLAEVKAFFKQVRLGETEDLVDEEEEDAIAAMMSMWSKPFLPNLLNTVVFLVETSQIIAVMFVNYKGACLRGHAVVFFFFLIMLPLLFFLSHSLLTLASSHLFTRLCLPFCFRRAGRPWMKGLLENTFLFLAVFLCIAFVAFCAWEISPEFNKLMHMHAFPDDEFRFTVIGLCLAAVFGTFCVDRICVLVFSREVGGAMLEEAAKTTPMDFLPVFSTLGKVIGGFILVGTGNPLVWIGCAYWWWRRRSAAQKALLAED